MRILIALALTFASTLTFAHSMSPAFEVEQALTPVHSKVYTLTNNYDHPAVFIIQVFNKDGTTAEGWKTDKTIYNLNPRSSREVLIKFKVKEQRKLLVCSTLVEIGKNHDKANVISRICSRFIVNGNFGVSQ